MFIWTRRPFLCIPRGPPTPLIQSLCVFSEFHIPSKTLTLDVILSESSLSLQAFLTLGFPRLLSFKKNSHCVTPSFSLFLLAVENNGVLLADFTFMGTFALVFSQDDPINVFTLGLSTGSTGTPVLQ